MGFNDFIKKHNLRNKATSNIKIQHVLSSLSLDDVGIYLRDGPFATYVGIINLHHQNVLTGYYTLMKISSIHMVVPLLRDYLNLS